MTTLWVQETAAHFWLNAGQPPPAFPRELRLPIALALPLAVVDLPRLRVGAVHAWLAQHRLHYPPLASADRPLRACLVAREGAGIVFLDGADPDDERRFSLAHEVAHFLVEQFLPRQQAAQRLGAPVLSVLDGHRAPTRDERVAAVLAGVSLSLSCHLMDRTSDGHPPGQHVTAAERQADDLALELLAPAESVLASLPAPFTTDAAEHALRSTFGLPADVARHYAAALIPPTPSQSLLQRLGLA